MNDIQKLLEEQRKQSEIHKIPEGKINKIIANKEKAMDIKWRENITRANKDPIKIQKRKESMPDQSGKNNPFYKKTHSEKTKQIISLKKKGSTPINKGVPHLEEDLKKMRKPRSEEGKKNMRGPRKKKTCPHCGTVGAGGNMGRYHFDNCKHKP